MRRIGAAGGEQLTEPGPDHGQAQQFLGLVRGQVGDDHQHDEAAHLGFAKVDDRPPNRCHLAHQRKIGRVDEAQQLVGDGHVRGDDLLQLGGGERRPVDFGQQPDLADLEAAHLAQADGLRPGEEVALEVVAAEVAGMFELLVGLDLFGQEFELVGRQPADERLDLRGRGEPVVDLDDARQLDERQQGVAVDEIVQGEQVAAVAQVPAGRDHLRAGLHVLQDLDDDPVAREGAGHPADEQVRGEVDEAGAGAGDAVDVLGEEGGGQQAAGGPLAAQFAELQPQGLAEEQFIGEQLLVDVEDRLAGDVNVHAAGESRGRVGVGRRLTGSV